MNWQEVCADPHLHNLPYKIELNEQGQIIMTPVRLYHSAWQGEIIRWLLRLTDSGKALPEVAIATAQGTKVADVVWCSDTLWQQIKHEAESPVAPEICVEVLSPTNTADEMLRKRMLYLAHGAEEVWLCSKDGTMQFFSADGALERSGLVPQFPTHLEL